LKRSLEVSLDPSTWISKPVPTALKASVGIRDVDVRIALLFTALCTRPPLCHGFDLSDFWAWLRYIPAIAATSDLRLLDAWTDIDPHQKSVLSDQLGVGFTTQYIAEMFLCGEFVDTNYVANVLDPKHFRLGKQAKTGPRKSPDYIAQLPNGEYIVVECKGAQSSRKSLMTAFESGRKQKKNLTTRGRKRISDALIAGLFIPQSKSKEQALIHLEDPTWVAIDDLLSERGEGAVRDAVDRTALAKNLALCNVPEAANWLQSGRPELRHAAQMAAEREQERSKSAEDVRISYEVILPVSREERARRRIGFSARAPEGLIELVAKDQVSARDIAAAYRSQAAPTGWSATSNHSHAELITPLGFRYKLTIEGID
jgi:hypothetical protein